MISRLATLLFIAQALALPQQTPLTSVNDGSIKVPVQLGVMSRCPDALICEATFNEVLKKVNDKVDLSLVYIGRFDETEPDLGVKCLHGRIECIGNIQQLCVKKYASFTQWWEFVQCQNGAGRYRVGEPAVALQCAAAVGIDWNESGVGECAGYSAEGTVPEGAGLLKESVKLGHDLSIRNSCTVLIGGKPVCVHDGSWKQCDNGHDVGDFVRQIEEEFKRLNSGD